MRNRLGREIREYFIPDFSKWKDHDSYQKAFERLLRDLKDEVRGDTPCPWRTPPPTAPRAGATRRVCAPTVAQRTGIRSA